MVKSVLSPSIFSPVPKVNPTLAGMTTSATAVRLMLLPAIVRSVPSPSIFSPSLPKVRPTLAGMLISTPAVRFMSPSAAKSNVASALELTEMAASLNCTFIAAFNSSPVSATCVRVTSLSAPKPSTAASDCKVRSSSTNKSGTARSCIRSNTAPPEPAPSVAIILTCPASTATLAPEP